MLNRCIKQIKQLMMKLKNVKPFNSRLAYAHTNNNTKKL